MMGHVMVTGASGGIGSAVVDALASSGQQVIALRRNAGEVADLSASGVRVVAADLAHVDELRDAVSGIDHLDALVHCAGVSTVESVAGTGAAAWHETLTINVTAAAELTRLLLPQLRASMGHVIFVNASPGMRAVPRWASFVASKAALRELADSLRFEEAENGVRVTTIYPAATATQGLRRIRAAFDRPYEPARCIKPESLAAMITWVLAGPPDSYVIELSVVPSPRPSDTRKGSPT
jgi:NADP-dependent 3-hydroxy acid dehydrogenase YdfG